MAKDEEINKPYKPEDEAERIHRNFSFSTIIHNDGSAERLGDSFEIFLDENGMPHETAEEAKEANELIEAEFEDWAEDVLDDFFNSEDMSCRIEDYEDEEELFCSIDDYGPNEDELLLEELAELEVFEEEYPEIAANKVSPNMFSTASGTPLETDVKSPKSEFNAMAAPAVTTETPANDATYDVAPAVERPKIAVAPAPAFG